MGQFKPGDKVECYSSVGRQVVTIIDVGLKVQNPFDPEVWTDEMVLVQYHVRPGRGMAHENQLRRIVLDLQYE